MTGRKAYQWTRQDPPFRRHSWMKLMHSLKCCDLGKKERISLLLKSDKTDNYFLWHVVPNIKKKVWIRLTTLLLLTKTQYQLTFSVRQSGKNRFHIIGSEKEHLELKLLCRSPNFGFQIAESLITWYHYHFICVLKYKQKSGPWVVLMDWTVLAETDMSDCNGFSFNYSILSCEGGKKGQVCSNREPVVNQSTDSRPDKGSNWPHFLSICKITASSFYLFCL